jgi:hypothetical protein
MRTLELIPWRFRSRQNFIKAHANHFFRHVLATPSIACDPEADVEVHVLVCQRDLHMCLLAVKSLLRFAPNVAVVIHEDGSVGSESRSLLTRHLPGSRVISRDEADSSLAGLLPQDMARARKEHVMLMKLFDVAHFNSGRRTILLDSDIVFIAQPNEVITWIAGQDNDVFYNRDPLQDTYRGTVRPAAPAPTHFNAGFLGHRHRISLEEALDAVAVMRYWTEDQSIYAYLLAPHSCKWLDPERYLVYQGGPISSGVRMVHFISTDRFSGSAYVDTCKQVCRELVS